MKCRIAYLTIKLNFRLISPKVKQIKYIRWSFWCKTDTYNKTITSKRKIIVSFIRFFHDLFIVALLCQILPFLSNQLCEKEICLDRFLNRSKSTIIFVILYTIEKCFTRHSVTSESIYQTDFLCIWPFCNPNMVSPLWHCCLKKRDVSSNFIYLPTHIVHLT